MFSIFFAFAVSTASANMTLPTVNTCEIEQDMVDFHEGAVERMQTQLDMMLTIQEDEKHLLDRVVRHERIGDRLIAEAAQLLQQSGPVVEPGTQHEVELLQERADHHYLIAEQYASMLAIQPGDVRDMMISIEDAQIRLDQAWMNLERCERGDGPVN